MHWLTDTAAQYRLRDALAAGKRVIRKVDGTWYLFGHANQALRYESQQQALSAIVKVLYPT